MQRDDVKQIKDALDIVELISERVTLRKVGKNYRGLCPFHSEKTPSFYVSPERQSYHCFGCGAGGDIFTFLMEIEGMPFKEALEVLASRAGITLEKGKGGETRKDLRSLLEEARQHYEDNLERPQGKIAREYLVRRKIPPGAWKKYGLGWACQSWNDLGEHLRKEGFSSREAVDAGLLVSGDRGTFDRFRGRLIFPIRDVAGRTIAFGGRLVSGEGAKYVNSPEGSLFSKRRNLYLLFKAKKAMREKGEAFLVEGYMDALRLHLAGFEEAVASLGTALSEEQGDLLRRFAGRVWVCYDADAAGQEAALRGMYILQSRGLDVRVMSLPPGEDPDSLVSAPEGADSFREFQRKALPLVPYHLKIRESLLKDPGSRSAGVEEILEKTGSLPSFEVAPYLSEIASAFGMFSHEVAKLLEEYRTRERSREKRMLSKEEENSSSGVYINREGREERTQLLEKVHVLEAALLYLLSRREYPSSRGFEELLPLFPEGFLRNLAVALLQEENTQALEARWLEMGDTFPFQILEKGAAFCEQISEEDNAWEKVYAALVWHGEKKTYLGLKEKIARNEATAEELQHFLELGKRLKKGGR
ncbi:MAG TPA: DNA primase [Synergistaceae bacterium]|nr:DNA primase [Synergistaceae bacterium]HPQ37064.1 DNA primase [Synergistaceae bacterium]